MKISIIIPTYNRFKYLLNAIDSIKNQSILSVSKPTIIPSIQIIIINDCSTQEEYYCYDFGKEVTLLNLEVNSKNKFGHTAIGYVRNRGLEVATGDYIAFLDDDDIMLPDSLYEKLKYMMNNSDFVCSDAYIGNGAYNLKNTYKKYNEENYIEIIKNIYLENNSNAMCYGFPSKFDNEFISIHNTVITSTVMMSKNLIDKVGKFSLASYGEDWDYWKRATLFTEIDYIKTPLSYYDASHGDGVQY